MAAVIAPQLSEVKATRGRLLFVDDEQAVVRAYRRVLERDGFVVETANNADSARALIGNGAFDAVLSDIKMPGMDGLDFLRVVRAQDADLPVIIMTAAPAVETAARAVEYGAHRYLVKPVSPQELTSVIDGAVRRHKEAREQRERLNRAGDDGASELAALDATFTQTLSTLWMAFQPIVSWKERRIIAHEALMRSAEKDLPNPPAILAAAERLGRLHDLGRVVRGRVAEALQTEPDRTAFVNLHSHELLDEELFSSSSPLAQFAPRIVLEVTERAGLGDIGDLVDRVGALRKLGYRMAVDDLGAGYAGLTTFAQLAPEVVKLDMALVRGVETAPTKQKVIRSVASLCRELEALMVAEGVETAEERDALVSLGCDAFQGYFFAKPGKGFGDAKF